ncbi:metalloendopeptidase OMA1, mitochondrial-like [Paramacrobiotus metropolitanus]|uniref:metalloendopeptidase OMA1, mitochondrial-like n=1 Tax=Paramacrobiotus metropolitanus TaxID=2943436 RepID=UPI002445DD71|nr:metalloendopeptidase OMA1, mitochondrial-like [Paramacrobiotus metropolitanus]
MSRWRNLLKISGNRAIYREALSRQWQLSLQSQVPIFLGQRSARCQLFAASTQRKAIACSIPYCTLVSRCFSTNTPRHALVVPTLAIRIVGIPLAVLVGRYARRYWMNKSLSERRRLLDAYLYYAAGGIMGLAMFALLYYYIHLDTAPVTKRKRFMLFNVNEFESIVEMEKAMLFRLMKNHFITTSHPAYKQVNRVVTRILKSNADLPAVKNKHWMVTVIDSPKQNAFVVPTGHIFVFTGILDILANDDHLAVVLSHELAHTILDHVPELHSTTHCAEISALFALAGIWLWIPSFMLALAASVVLYEIISLCVYLPHHRLLELEADEVGLRLTAKACYDVRENVAFWQRMHLINKIQRSVDINAVTVPEYFSTHPSHRKRAAKLAQQMPEALALRESCNCSPLPAKDPSLDVAKLRLAMRNAKEFNDPWKPFTSEV